MGQFIDLTDKTFGEWHVDRYLGKQMWECTCSCGKVKSINGADLRKHKSTSCGHTRKDDLTGRTFGGYKVLKYNGDYRWVCECLECGEQHVIHTYFLEHNQLPKCKHGGQDERLIDMVNKTFGEWKVDSYAGKKMWNCTCSCGTKRVVSGKDLRSGRSKHCGHNRKNIENFLNSDKTFMDLTNKQFGDWKVIKYAGNSKWLCECSCGKIGKVASAELRNGSSKSCGHGKNEFKDIKDQHFGELKAIKYLGKQMWECECSCGETVIEHGYRLRSGQRTVCNFNKHKINEMLNKEFGDITTKEYLGHNLWKCECSCGNILTVMGHNLRNGNTTSCGCKTYENKYKTMLQNGNMAFRSDEQIKASANSKSLRQFIQDKYGDNKITLDELAELLGITYASAIRTVQRLDIRGIIKQTASSRQEKEILNLLEQAYTEEIITHDRQTLGGLELDIYIPDKQLAIEFNGNY